MHPKEDFNPLFTRRMPFWKRALDIIGSLFLLIVLAPLFFVIYAYIKIVSPGPAFFRQERIGFGGAPFTFWKFRTMRVNADTSEHQEHLKQLINSSPGGTDQGKPMIKLERNPNIIPGGRLLRASALDELPQLYNVLKGEMSLVGPRPPIPYEVENYPLWFNGRFHTLPGMTGLWQVSGKNRLTFTEMMRLDIRYSKQLSPWLDIKILLLTPLAMINQLLDTAAPPRENAEKGDDSEHD